MKKLISLMLCLTFIIPCAFAEDMPRTIGESDAGYAWLYENALTVAERFQYGLDCTWHSFLLSAANVPEQEMLSALAPLRMQDYNQPLSVAFVRADQLLPDEMVEAWQAALKAEEEARAARAALRSAELVNELAIVKLANAEEAVIKAVEDAVKAAEDAFKAAEEAARLAEEEAAESAKKRGAGPEAETAEKTAQTAKEILQAAQEAFKAAEEAAQAVKESEKGEAFLAAKSAAKAAEKTSKIVKEARKAAEEAAKAAAEEAEAEETPEPARSAKAPENIEKTPAELAAEEAFYRIEEAVLATENASKAAEEAFKAEANAIQAAQTLDDLKAGKYTQDTGDDSDLEFSDDSDFEEDFGLDSDDGEGEDDSDYLSLDFDFDAEGAEDGVEAEGTSGDEWDWDWDDWDDSGSSSASQQEVKDPWFIEEDPERDLYHCAPKVLNFHEEDKMFSAISDAIQVMGFYTCEEALDIPCCAVVSYGGLYDLLITWYPAGDGFVSVNAQVIYARSADQLIMP